MCGIGSIPVRAFNQYRESVNYAQQVHRLQRINDIALAVNKLSMLAAIVPTCTIFPTLDFSIAMSINSRTQHSIDYWERMAFTSAFQVRFRAATFLTKHFGS